MSELILKRFLNTHSWRDIFNNSNSNIDDDDTYDHVDEKSFQLLNKLSRSVSTETEKGLANQILWEYLMTEQNNRHRKVDQEIHQFVQSQNEKIGPDHSEINKTNSYDTMMICMIDHLEKSIQRLDQESSQCLDQLERVVDELLDIKHDNTPRIDDEGKRSNEVRLAMEQVLDAP
ncbi:hypothetical protein NADFUDRAFT_40153 [Nadsonia fulvescens var. elongata DSM 6958]|uniref:Uncharacterized protein n=1 Tax=Nadsonia fulvescens var. elongata DSM 6958 TaxID=857566 RepID=A0A1E3PNT7_9ASCO|nr:hypothetical protein NADFUDRAFT_40153 [Nadsonia fulvescens var. elongata DSM 6958]